MCPRICVFFSYVKPMSKEFKLHSNWACLERIRIKTSPQGNKVISRTDTHGLGQLFFFINFSSSIFKYFKCTPYNIDIYWI